MMDPSTIITAVSLGIEAFDLIKELADAPDAQERAQAFLDKNEVAEARHALLVHKAEQEA